MNLRTAGCAVTIVAALTLSGCASATDSSTGAAPPPGAAATVPIIETRVVYAGVGGVTAQERAVLYADGTLIRSTADGWASTTYSPDQIRELFDRAAADGLLDDAVDLGPGRVSDTSWTTLTLTTDTATIEHRVALVDNPSDRQRDARAAVERTVGSLLFGAGEPYAPDRALALVEDGNLLDLPAPAPPWTGTTMLEQQSTCVELTGDDLGLLDGLLDEQGARDGLDRSVVVLGADSNTYRLRVRELFPHDPGCP